MFVTFRDTCLHWGIKKVGTIEEMKEALFQWMVYNVNTVEVLRIGFKPELQDEDEREAQMKKQLDKFAYDSDVGDVIMLSLMILFDVVLRVIKLDFFGEPTCEDWVPTGMVVKDQPKVPVVYVIGHSLQGDALPHYLATAPFDADQTEAKLPSIWRCEHPLECLWSNEDYVRMAAAGPVQPTPMEAPLVAREPRAAALASLQKLKRADHKTGKDTQQARGKRKTQVLDDDENDGKKESKRTRQKAKSTTVGDDKTKKDTESEASRTNDTTNK
jgi:hypothetical protein